MLEFIPKKMSSICLSLLSLTMLTNCAFGFENDKLTYLDSISNSYLQGQATSSSLINMNSPEARAIETTMRIDNTSIITNSDAKINLSLRDSDVKQVLRMLADKAKINIVLDSSIEGKITLDLNNVKLNDAFMIIFKSAQLTYSMDGNTLSVMTLKTAKESAYTRKVMTVIPVKYVNADSVAEFLNANLFQSNVFGLSSHPIVTSNPRTNQIIVFGTSADVAAINRILPAIDTKPFVNNFKVNHTTPKEMAELICNALFATSIVTEGGGSQTSVDVDDAEEADLDEDEIVLGGGVVACRDTASQDSGSKSSSDSLKSFKSNPLTVVYFSDLGKISTYGGSLEQTEVIKDFILENDKKQLMAYIELSVIELNESGSKDFSNAWNLWTPFISLSFDGTSFGIGQGTNVISTSDSPATPWYIWGKNKSGTSITNNRALTYSLQYAIQNGNGRVVTNPKIMVTNGRKATIDMTADYVKSVTSQVLQSSSSVTSATQKTYEIGSDQGILIEIVPFISPDGYVSMNITPEFSTIKEQQTDYTLLQRRDLELRNVRIKDGETLVLAGLIQDNDSQSVTKMPILSDLPFIGAFFRSSHTTKSKSEIVIVVTPHIIKDEDELAQNNKYDL